MPKPWGVARYGGREETISRPSDKGSSALVDAVLGAKWPFFSIPCPYFMPFAQLKIIIIIKMHLEDVAQY